VSKELLEKMREAGCIFISYGVESCDPETLRKIRKPLTVEGIHQGIKATIDSGIDFKINLILGFPWESEKHINSSVEFVKTIYRTPKSHRFRVEIIHPIPYPGSKLYDDFHEEYDFTEWWLDKNRNRINRLGFLEKEEPFYRDRFAYLDDLYFKDIYGFWNYSPEFENFLKKKRLYCEIRNHPLRIGYTLYILALISKELYSVSPKLEHLIFRKFLPKIFNIMKSI